MDKKYISLVSDSMPISSRNLINSVNSHKSTQVSKKSEYKIAQSEIRHYMDKYCNDEVLFSGSVLVARGDDILLSEGYGMANYNKGIANTVKTVFEIASITKQFTALAILMLEEKGLLNIEETIDKYIHDYPSGHKIKIYNLLTMTSGIYNYTQTYEDLVGEDRDYYPEEVISLFKDSPLNFEVGTKYEYSNSNYILLGYIIEKVSGMKYEEYLEENILKPLNMNNTSFLGKNYIKNKAIGYKVYESDDNSYIEVTGANGTLVYSAGNICSTIEDLYKWSRSLFSGTLVKKETLQKMYSPYLMDYGMGVVVCESSSENKTVLHGGNIQGFSSYISMNLLKEYTIIILTNRENFFDIDNLGTTLTTILNKAL